MHLAVTPQAEEKEELNRRRKKLRLAEERRWREKEAQTAHREFKAESVFAHDHVERKDEEEFNMFQPEVRYFAVTMLLR